MWIVPLLLLLSPSAADDQKLKVLTFPANAGGRKNNHVEYDLPGTSVSEFSVCLFLRPLYQIHINAQTLLKIPGFLSVNIDEDSSGGWIVIDKEKINFQFKTAMFPRTWNGFCIQQTSEERKIWHKNETIFVRKLQEKINFEIMVLILTLF